MMSKAHEVFVAAGLLPQEMPVNYTFDRVREVLAGLGARGEDELRAAAESATRLGVRGPLAAAVFVLHHLSGGHEVEVDRLAVNEGTGERFGVLVYPEGEVTVGAANLPEGTGAGARLRYDPAAGSYTAAQNTATERRDALPGRS